MVQDRLRSLSSREGRCCLRWIPRMRHSRYDRHPWSCDVASMRRKDVPALESSAAQGPRPALRTGPPHSGARPPETLRPDLSFAPSAQREFTQLRITGSRNPRASPRKREFRPSKSRVGSGRTLNCPDSSFAFLGDFSFNNY